MRSRSTKSISYDSRWWIKLQYQNIISNETDVKIIFSRTFSIDWTSNARQHRVVMKIDVYIESIVQFKTMVTTFRLKEPLSQCKIPIRRNITFNLAKDFILWLINFFFQKTLYNNLFLQESEFDIDWPQSINWISKAFN